jgi:hypothetical protein
MQTVVMARWRLRSASRSPEVGVMSAEAARAGGVGIARVGYGQGGNGECEGKKG